MSKLVASCMTDWHHLATSSGAYTVCWKPGQITSSSCFIFQIADYFSIRRNLQEVWAFLSWRQSLQNHLGISLLLWPSKTGIGRRPRSEVHQGYPSRNSGFPWISKMSTTNFLGLSEIFQLPVNLLVIIIQDLKKNAGVANVQTAFLLAEVQNPCLMPFLYCLGQ